MTRTFVLVSKELRDLLRNWGLLVALLLPALLIPALALASLGAVTGAELGSLTSLIPLRPNLAVPPELLGASPRELAQYAVLSPFFMIALIFPVTVPSILAAASIVGEKESGTLEGLLATPIRTWELLLGKAFASLLPAVVLTWLPFGAMVLGAQQMTTPQVVAATLTSGPWLFGIFVLAPTLALLTIMFLIIVSAWATEVRTANQLGAVLIAPLVAMLVLQATQGVAFTMGKLLGLWGVAMTLLLLTQPVAVRLFQRETILVRWKQAGS